MNITTLEQAASHLISVGAVNMQTMQVEGKQLLEACGYKKIDNTSIIRQASRLDLKQGRDYKKIKLSSNGGRPPEVFLFPISSASKVYLAAVSILRRQTVKEDSALSTIEQLLGITLERQFVVGKYRIDGYHKDSNTAYEIDESYHKHQERNDISRQKHIESKLGCKFVRIKL